MTVEGGHHSGVTGSMTQAEATEALMALERDSYIAHRPAVIFFLEGNAIWEISDGAQGINGAAPARSRW